MITFISSVQVSRVSPTAGKKMAGIIETGVGLQLQSNQDSVGAGFILARKGLNID